MPNRWLQARLNISSGACRPAQSRHADVPSSETGRTALAQMEHFVADIGSSSVQLGQLKLAMGFNALAEVEAKHCAKGQNWTLRNPLICRASSKKKGRWNARLHPLECPARLAARRTKKQPSPSIRMPSTFSSAAYEEAKARHRRLSRASEKVFRAAGAWPG